MKRAQEAVEALSSFVFGEELLNLEDLSRGETGDPKKLSGESYEDLVSFGITKAEKDQIKKHAENIIKRKHGLCIHFSTYFWLFQYSVFVV